MKIALVVHDARPGGGQDRYVLELANGLAANHDVTVVAISAEGLSEAERSARAKVAQTYFQIAVQAAREIPRD